RAKRMLQEAALERHTTISQFVIDSAMSAAQEILTERTRIGLTSEQWAALMAALDAPLRMPRCQRLDSFLLELRLSTWQHDGQPNP
ncbi:MAG: DUF1778 domain-containing protein, partial [Alphaproteobacteria bacterium]|nr:DUF1778 domain-containing protein [Alphaproteobacteria bacterium]